jgi:hypothetical protein
MLFFGYTPVWQTTSRQSAKNVRVLMGGPGGLGPPGGGITGAAPPLRGVVEARRAGTRGETSPLLSMPFYVDCLLQPGGEMWAKALPMTGGKGTGINR